MTNMTPTLQARADRKSAKQDKKKRQIADSAITALHELGYANTSLRDIAAKSEMSLGILHYYFEDRSDLIIFCVRIYKQEFVAGIRHALDRAKGRDAVIDALAGALAVSITKDASTHRLWYDIRNQALFDDRFQPVTSEIETTLVSMVSHAFMRAGHATPPRVELQYALLDGVFRFLLQDQLCGTFRSTKATKAIFAQILKQVL
jgi:AcrR family transcriptional regulator